MEDNFIIKDTRDHSQFKELTFSGFKKTQVINTVFKNIEAKKVEGACHWTTECIISGYANILWEKIIIFSSKVIHINNPRLPEYLCNKDIIYNNQLKLIDPKNKDRYIFLRNSQMIRNLFFDVVTTLTTSLKTKRYDKYSKVDTSEDFKYENMKKRLCGGMNILPDHIMRFNDPDEIKIILNEIFTMLKNKQFGYDRCCFWILWLLKWEGQHKKKKLQWRVEYRDVKEVDTKYRSNVVWIVWDIINEELKSRDENVRKQISFLYKLFTNNFTIGKRNSRLPLLFHAVGYLTHTINFSIPIRTNFKLFIEVQCNVNKMFGAKKQHEKIEEIKPVPKKLKKKDKIDVEIIKDKISIFNELDNI
tara:strand:- start:779 stop:1861 length:1083 start_codon:yes stop_codon:yes gene_type:complete